MKMQTSDRDFGKTDSKLTGEAWSIPEISYRDSLGEYRLRRKGRVKEVSFQLLKEKRG